MSPALAPGRNDSEIVGHGTAKRLRKHLRGDPRDVSRRMDNLAAWDRLLEGSPGFPSPRLTAWDRDGHVVEHEFVEHQSSLQDLLAAGPSDTLTTALSRAAELVARIHGAAAPEQRLPTHGIDLGRRPSAFMALAVSDYAECSGAELDVWGMLQHDTELQEALEGWQRTLTVPTAHQGPRHGDVRPDQFLVRADGSLVVIDLEEFGWGATVTDLSALAGSILFDAMTRTFGSVIDEGDDVLSIHQGFMDRGEAALLAASPALVSLVSSYEHASGRRVDLMQLTCGAGWFIMERIIARSKMSYRLAAGERAIAGVGRQAIVDPASALPLFDREARA